MRAPDERNGIHPHKNFVYLDFKAAAPIDSTRIAGMEQISKNCWHCTVKLESAEQIDGELLGRLHDAYELSR